MELHSNTIFFSTANMKHLVSRHHLHRQLSHRCAFRLCLAFSRGLFLLTSPSLLSSFCIRGPCTKTTPPRWTRRHRKWRSLGCLGSYVENVESVYCRQGRLVTGWIDDTVKGAGIEFWSCGGSRWRNLWQRDVIPAVSWGVGTGLGGRLWRKVTNCG